MPGLVLPKVMYQSVGKVGTSANSSSVFVVTSYVQIRPTVVPSPPAIAMKSLPPGPKRMPWAKARAAGGEGGV